MSELVGAVSTVAWAGTKVVPAGAAAGAAAEATEEGGPDTSMASVAGPVTLLVFEVVTGVVTEEATCDDWLVDDTTPEVTTGVVTEVTVVVKTCEKETPERDISWVATEEAAEEATGLVAVVISGEAAEVVAGVTTGVVAETTTDEEGICLLTLLLASTLSEVARVAADVLFF